MSSPSPCRRTETLTGAQIVVRLLERQGVRTLSGIPGGAIASFAALATMAGLPAGVMGVYISINTLCDMGATCVNVIGDMAGCVVLKEKIKLED